MKYLIAITIALMLTLGAALNCHAQAIPITGTPILINGNHFLLTETNGVYTATATDAAGNQYSISSPKSATDALNQIETIVSENNPANTNFYSATEIEARLGGVYEQNSGEAAAVISITKWGLLPSWPVGTEVGLLQGNQNGTSGTAGAYGMIDYRKIIGDVSAVGGIGGIYDNYNHAPGLIVKGGVEYRQNAHIGEWVDLNYALEAKGNASRGFGFAAGLSYAF